MPHTNRWISHPLARICGAYATRVLWHTYILYMYVKGYCVALVRGLCCLRSGAAGTTVSMNHNVRVCHTTQKRDPFSKTKPSTKILTGICVAYAITQPLTKQLAYLPKSNANRGMYYPTCVIACETSLQSGLVTTGRGHHYTNDTARYNKDKMSTRICVAYG